MTSKEFGFLFVVIEFIINGVSIWINELDHWISFYRDFSLGFIQLVGFLMSSVMPSEHLDWSYLWNGFDLMASAFLIQLIAFGITGVIASRS